MTTFPSHNDRLAEIKKWYVLHAVPQRRLLEDIMWLVNRVEELEALQEAGTDTQPSSDTNGHRTTR